jgi:hypothetical protein
LPSDWGRALSLCTARSRDDTTLRASGNERPDLIFELDDGSEPFCLLLPVLRHDLTCPLFMNSCAQSALPKKIG